MQTLFESKVRCQAVNFIYVGLQFYIGLYIAKHISHYHSIQHKTCECHKDPVYKIFCVGIGMNHHSHDPRNQHHVNPTSLTFDLALYKTFCNHID